MPRNNLRPQISVVQAQNIAQVRRRTRRPKHTFNLKSRPYEVAPFLIAPVLPGETLENVLLQARVVSDPIKNALIGWHKEYYFFYVKHRALATPEVAGGVTDSTGLLQTMMLDPATDVSTLKGSANSVPFYNFKTGMRFTEMCLTAVVNEYFRDEGEGYAVASGFDYPLARIDQENWAQSLKLEAAGADDAELPGVDELEELDILPGFSSQYAQWEIMRDSGLTDATYEDYLRSYGVQVPKAEDEGLTPDQKHRPELIRFVREWTYPTNHVDPATGIPASAVSWSVAERADKKRFFKEPGFVFGCTVARPKVYLGSQKGSAVGMLDNLYSWLPAVLAEHAYISVREVLDSATDGILQNQAADYWLDMKDLFLYGDQFVNHAFSEAANHGIALPSATLEKRYPTEAMVNALFTNALANNSVHIREDGVVHLNVLGRQVETTAGPGA